MCISALCQYSSFALNTVKSYLPSAQTAAKIGIGVAVTGLAGYWLSSQSIAPSEPTACIPHSFLGIQTSLKECFPIRELERLTPLANKILDVSQDALHAANKTVITILDQSESTLNSIADAAPCASQSVSQLVSDTFSQITQLAQNIPTAIYQNAYCAFEHVTGFAHRAISFDAERTSSVMSIFLRIAPGVFLGLIPFLPVLVRKDAKQKQALNETQAIRGNVRQAPGSDNARPVPISSLISLNSHGGDRSKGSQAVEFTFQDLDGNNSTQTFGQEEDTKDSSLSNTQRQQVEGPIPRGVGFPPDSLRYKIAAEIKVCKDLCQFYPGCDVPIPDSEKNLVCITPKIQVFKEEPSESHLKAILISEQIFERMSSIISTNFISRTVDLSKYSDVDAGIQSLSKLKICQDRKWKHIMINEYCKSFVDEILETNIGNCAQLAFVAYGFLKEEFPEADITFTSPQKSNHVFLCLNKELVIDPWSRSVFPVSRRDLLRNYIAPVLALVKDKPMHLPVVTKLDQSQELIHWPAKIVSRN